MQKPRWFEEAARTASNWIAAAIVVITGVVAAVTPFTDLVPGEYRTQFVAIVSGLGAVAAVLAKVQGTLTRKNVWSAASHYDSVAEAQWLAAVQTREQVHQEAHAAPEAPSLPSHLA